MDTIGTIETPKGDIDVLIPLSLVAVSFLTCLLYMVCHRKRKRRSHRHRHLGLHRSGGHYDSSTSATGTIVELLASYESTVTT